MLEMSNVGKFGFVELDSDEKMQVAGGAFPVLFVIWGVKVTVGHCLAAGAAVGLAAVALD